MLTQIHIRHFIMIHELQLDFQVGTTVITGETGSGKSILIHAIELALGGRAASHLVRKGQDKAEICLSFDISALPDAKKWLNQYDLAQENHECFLRRVIYVDGRSRHFINGMPTTLEPLRELGDLLMDIHGQHEHHSLLKVERQRTLLDHYANHTDLVNKTVTLSEHWHALNNKINHLKKTIAERETKSALLNYQLDELNSLHLMPNEFESLDLEHKKLTHAGELLQTINQALGELTHHDESHALYHLNKAFEALQSIQTLSPSIASWMESLKTAMILISDVEDELNRYSDTIKFDPERLQKTDERLTLLFDTARKYKVAPLNLFDLHQTLSDEYNQTEKDDTKLSEHIQQLDELTKNYHHEAKKLSLSRERFAKKMSQEITKTIQTLSLPHATFHVHCETNETSHPSNDGFEKIIFQIKTSKDQAYLPIAKVVSGGELSRISLAIHIATAKQETGTSFIFDEIDVGIGGGTAEVVGKLLRRLGETHQVLCITHQPQVAALGHHHLRVIKTEQNKMTVSQFEFLSMQEKMNELARMLGGIHITQKTLEHASELVEKLS